MDSNAFSLDKFSVQGELNQVIGIGSVVCGHRAFHTAGKTGNISFATYDANVLLWTSMRIFLWRYNFQKLIHHSIYG